MCDLNLEMRGFGVLGFWGLGFGVRSEERRVGKECSVVCSYRWGACD